MKENKMFHKSLPLLVDTICCIFIVIYILIHHSLTLQPVPCQPSENSDCDDDFHWQISSRFFSSILFFSQRRCHRRRRRWCQCRRLTTLFLVVVRYIFSTLLCRVLNHLFSDLFPSHDSLCALMRLLSSLSCSRN